MLRDEVAKYTELSGNDGEHTPIGIIGAYLDGYDKGRRTLIDDVKAEIQAKYDSIPWRNNEYEDGWIEALEWVLFPILDNIGKAESEEKNEITSM